MQSRIRGSWTGWRGSTVVTLENGTMWKQASYLYHYQYSYRPSVRIEGGMMYVEGMPEAVRVRRVH